MSNVVLPLCSWVSHAAHLPTMYAGGSTRNDSNNTHCSSTKCLWQCHVCLHSQRTWSTVYGQPMVDGQWSNNGEQKYTTIHDNQTTMQETVNIPTPPQPPPINTHTHTLAHVLTACHPGSATSLPTPAAAPPPPSAVSQDDVQAMQQSTPTVLHSSPDPPQAMS